MHKCFNIVEPKSKSALIQYLHQCAFSPVKTTWIKEIKNNQFLPWPGLTPQAVEKYLPASLATDLGHLNNTRQHTHKIN